MQMRLTRAKINKTISIYIINISLLKIKISKSSAFSHSFTLQFTSLCVNGLNIHDPSLAPLSHDSISHFFKLQHSRPSEKQRIAGWAFPEEHGEILPTGRGRSAARVSAAALCGQI